MQRSLPFSLLVAGLFLASALVLLIGIGVFFTAEHRRITYSVSEQRLQNQVNSVFGPAPSGSPAAVGNLPDLAYDLAVRLLGSGTEVVVLNADGVPQPPQLGAGPWLSQAQHAAALAAGRPQTLLAPAPDGERLVYVLPLRSADGQAAGTLEAAIPVAPLEEEITLVSGWLMVIMLAAAALVVLAAPWLARLALRPVRRLSHAARNVADGDFDHRVPSPRISEMRDLSLAFNTMLDRIQDALRAESDTSAAFRRFMADASHELRSPLAVLGNGVEVLDRAMRRNDSAQVERSLEIMRREIGTMSQLVDDLLLLARYERPDLSGQAVPADEVEPMPLLEEVCERARLLASGQDLRLEWPRHDVAPVMADREALRRALNNLVENALRHTPSGRAVALSVAASPGACRFTVRDAGAGIAPEHLPHIFERFFRAETAPGQGPSQPRQGTGLGLAIVRAIVTSHGGWIEVASRVGAGTRITLVIPATASASLTARSQASQGGAQPGEVRVLDW